MEIRKSVVKELCDKHLDSTDLEPRDGKTFCNLFVCRVFVDLNYFKFRNRLANEIYDFCQQTKTEWREVDSKQAIIKADEDYFVVAASRGNPHGHVSICYPAPPVYSKKWDIFCPVVASAGSINGVFGSNWVFKTMPTFFLFLEW